ncbi:MAG: hypothetical protein GY861_21605 [bacterium]|nr:hypothetical protein [bacterium]
MGVIRNSLCKSVFGNVDVASLLCDQFSGIISYMSTDNVLYTLFVLSRDRLSPPDFSSVSSLLINRYGWVVGRTGRNQLREINGKVTLDYGFFGSSTLARCNKELVEAVILVKASSEQIPCDLFVSRVKLIHLFGAVIRNSDRVGESLNVPSHNLCYDDYFNLADVIA